MIENQDIDEGLLNKESNIINGGQNHGETAIINGSNNTKLKLMGKEHQKLINIKDGTSMEKYYLRKENNIFSTLLPMELMPFFTFSDYHQLITIINNYKSPSEKFYLTMMVFEFLLFFVAIGLGFYFISMSSSGRTIALGLFLLVLSILALVGCSVTYFKKSKMTIEDISDFYSQINKRYELKQIKFIGVFKKLVYPKLGHNYYRIEHKEIIIEYPRVVNAQGVLMHNINTGSVQYISINSNDNNISSQKIPLLSPRSSPSSSIDNDKL